MNWVLDCDIRGFFDTLDHGWLVKFIEHRVADRRVVRLIQKWLRAGVMEEGKQIAKRDRDGSRRKHQSASGQHLSALCVRSVDPAMEEKQSAWRCGCGAVCG